MYDLKILSKFGLYRTLKTFKVLSHNFPFHICIQLVPMTFCMETLTVFKKSLVERSLNL